MLHPFCPQMPRQTAMQNNMEKIENNKNIIKRCEQDTCCVRITIMAAQAHTILRLTRSLSHGDEAHANGMQCAAKYEIGEGETILTNYWIGPSESTWSYIIKQDGVLKTYTVSGTEAEFRAITFTHEVSDFQRDSYPTTADLSAVNQNK